MDAEYIPYTKIVEQLPIHNGDILNVHSDVLELAKICRNYGEKFEGDRFIQSLQEAVGENGTLLFPTFNWDFCKGIAFDYHNTKGKSGALGNVALKMPGFKRTQHPIYSFAVWGKAQSVLLALRNRSSWSNDSPFAYLHHNNGKVLIVGLPGVISTFVHYVEQMVGVDYRYHKNFCATYVDENGCVDDRTYSIYVRDLEADPQRISRDSLLGAMSVLGICTDFVVNGVPIHILDLAGVFEVISLEIQYNNANNLYTFSKGK